MTIAFVVVRGLNIDGDPSRWSAQCSGDVQLLSFLDTTVTAIALIPADDARTGVIGVGVA